MTQESRRLEQAREGAAWRKWGPYLSERQWGTVREDYSKDGNAWDYFSHDQARSRAYRWGEDGLAGISDDRSFRRTNGISVTLTRRCTPGPPSSRTGSSKCVAAAVTLTGWSARSRSFC